MTTESNAPVPVWTLATQNVRVLNVMGDGGMTPARLAELRTVMASLADTPIATLQAHPLIVKRDHSGGIPLHAASPLAQQLSELVAHTTKAATPAVDAAAAGEVLYRMVVPAKFAAQVSTGFVKPMTSGAVAGGVYSGLRGSAGLVANATFVPVAGKAAGAGTAAVAGAAGGSAATAGVTVASAGALTVAAPLVLMAVAVGVSAYAEHKRQESTERIAELLEQLHEDKLDEERSDLDGCRDAIDKATSILLDQGRTGHSLGLDSASYAISTAIEQARRRLTKWQAALASLPEGPVDLGTLVKAFPGIDEAGGRFRAHLELARLAIALKRRVLVLQAVEHAQADGGKNPFTAFLGTLQEDERRVDDLESGVTSVLLRLSSLELKRRSGLQSPMFTAGQVDHLLRAAYRLRAFGDDIGSGAPQPDVAIEIEQSSDGSIVVFPATAA